MNGGDASPVFTSVQGDLPRAPVYTGLIELHGENTAIIGTDLGVFSTSNLATGNPPTWVPDMLNIGDVAITEIRQQIIRDYHVENWGMIYLSSYGHGLWYEPTFWAPVGIDPEPVKSTLAESLRLSPNPAGNIVKISGTCETGGLVTVKIFDMTGRLVMTTGLGNQPRGSYNGTIDVSSLPAGTYLVRSGNAYAKMVKM
jgi:hypothetical protein